MKKLALFFAVCCCFLLAANPQTYQIRETQLEALEAICQKYKANNQKLMVQLNDSKSESTLLNQQLLQERNLTKSLNESLVKYENSVSALERECDTLRIQNQQKETEIQKLKTEKQKMVTTIVALVGSLILFLLTAVVVLVFRTKK